VTSLVSVILPVFNGAAYLRPALQSVQQQRVDVQLIVVDDGSTDDTPAILAEFEPAVSVITQPNRGAAAARNSGLGAATGRYISFIDADDLWTRGRLRRQLRYLEAEPAIGLVQERIQHIHFDGVKWLPRGDAFHALSLSAALFRREVFDRVGLLDESMLFCDDMDWFLRARRSDVNVVRHDDVALLHRRHERNLTNRTDLVKHYTLRTILKNRAPAGTGKR
jgi:glycosyltransferase involved in cell wall biosynthesis